MLGYSHAMSGAMVWLLASPVVAHALNEPLGPKELAAGAIACAGAAVIPDLDHPQATVARTFGPASQAVAKGVALVAGGHRQGTHSLLFVGGFGLMCSLFAMGGSTWAMILMFLLAAFCFRALNLVIPGTSYSFKGAVILVEAVVAVALIVHFMPGSWWWLGFACALGCFVHLIGDALTPEGVPFFWPARWRGSIPIIAHTGNWLEKSVISPVMSLVVLWLIWSTLVHPLVASHV